MATNYTNRAGWSSSTFLVTRQTALRIVPEKQPGRRFKIRLLAKQEHPIFENNMRIKVEINASELNQIP